MVKSLAISCKELDQQFLAKSKSITLARDVAEGRMAIRFIAVDKDLNCRKGLLGVQRMQDNSAADLVRATVAVLTRFCTTKMGHHLAWLRRRIRAHVHCITVDSASDEVLASEMMRKPILELIRPVTPNAIVMRDKAHASRRVLSRPWQAIPALMEVVNRWVRGRSSPCQLVMHSPTFRAWFHSFIACDRNRLRGLRANVNAAKHRFDSYARPLGRCCRNFLSILKTAVKIARVRKDDSAGKIMRQFLHTLCPQECVILAMCADASDECLLLTRMCDREDIDVTELANHCADFLLNIRDMFGENRSCLHRETYTKLMIGMLKTDLVWVVSGKQYSLTAASDASINACFDIMMSWLPLAAETVQAEFPGYELAQAFGVFNLAGSKPGGTETHFRRLALAASVDASQLKIEFDLFQPLANREFECGNGAGNCQVAWSNALRTGMKHTSKCGRTNNLYPLAALIQVVYRWMGFCPSTSGIEQGFSKMKWGFKDRQIHASPDFEEATLKLLVDGRNDNLGTVVCPRAQKAWVSLFGRARRSGSEHRPLRIDTGSTKRAAPDDPSASEVAFVKRLRQSRLKSQRTVQAEVGLIPVSKVWGPGHDKEMKFIKDKQHARLVQAAGEDLLLPEETSQALAGEAKAVLAARKKAEVSRNRRTQYHLRYFAHAWTLPKAGVFRDKATFVEDNSWWPELARHGIKHATDPGVADLFVVREPGTAKLCGWRWGAALRGSYCITPKVLADRTGACVKFKCALAIQRKVFVSSQFKARHPAVWVIIQAAIGSPISKWKLISRASFLARRAAHPKACDTVALVVSSDSLTDKHAYVGPSFFGRFAEVDDLHTCTGTP